MTRLQSSMRSVIAVVAASLLLVAYSSGAESGPSKRSTSGKVSPKSQAIKKSRTVLVDQFMFQPAIIRVHAGDIVEWKNAGSVPHTATSTDGKTFDSASIRTGGSWRFKAAKKGTFNYVCTLHPNMKGKLIVE